MYLIWQREIGANLRNSVLNDLLGCQIRLVADQELVDTLRCVAVDFLQPLLDIRESVFRDMKYRISVSKNKGRLSRQK
jgi:hypothetical protein